ncbi:AAA family ATPase [Acinetobacter venetianus]|uniref:AAA family ATPase n=1 Tax=Acinetobacter venetianus TaxID=52133 RepID=UPI003A8EB0DF
MISKITLENFSAFENISLDCSSQINVIVGENSSGKTQVLKAAYLLGKASELKSQGKSDSQISAQIKSSLLGLFKPRSRRLGGIVNRNAPQNSRIAIDDAYGLTNEIKIEHNKSTETLNILNDSFDAEAGVFIPTKEVLTLLPALESEIVDEKQLRALFDETVVDLCLALLNKELLDEKELLNQDQRLGGVLKLLCENIKGQYRYRGNDHYFIAGDYQQYRDNSNEFWFKPIPDSELSTTMTAEGYRKIGMIQQLILNGAINNSSKSPLYWDEPESNLNPKLMKMIVKSLLEISRNGKQVFVATHDYALLKWFDLLANKDVKHGDSIRYHLLKKDPESHKILYEHSDDYSVISKSSISDTYAEIYDADVERALAI